MSRLRPTSQVRTEPNAFEQGVEEAARTIQDLAQAGIDLHCVAWRLEHEGIKQFTDAFEPIARWKKSDVMR